MGITAINGIPITASLATNAASASTGLVTTNATHYITFVDGNNLTPAPEVLGTIGTLTYNPSTGQMAAGGITSSLFGTASAARNVDVGVGSGNATNYLTFTPTFNAGGTAPLPLSESANCIYNPNTQEFRASLVNNMANGSKVNTADANLTIDASLTQSMTWIASLTTTRSLIVNNLTDGREVQVYIRNTNATQRQIVFSGSTTTTGHVAINMSAGAGAASVQIQNIAGTSGTMYVIIKTIGTTFVGGIM